MQCKKCGAELLDTAKVCDVCGEPVVKDELTLMDFYEEVPSDEDDGVGVYFVPSDGSLAYGSGAAMDPFEASKRRNAILAAAIITVVVVAGILAYTFVTNAQTAAEEEAVAVTAAKQTQEKKKAPSKSPATQVLVVLPIEVEGDGLGDEGSRIPISVTKATLNSAESTSEAQGIKETVNYIQGDGSGLALETGDYIITIAGTPISDQGVLYWYPNTEFRVHVPGENGAEYEVEEAETATLSVRYNGEVSEDQINEARSWIEKDAQKSSTAETLSQRARERYL